MNGFIWEYRGYVDRGNKHVPPRLSTGQLSTHAILMAARHSLTAYTIFDFRSCAISSSLVFPFKIVTQREKDNIANIDIKDLIYLLIGKRHL